MIVHKRGMNHCGTKTKGKVHAQWKFVTCLNCITKGQNKIPKALQKKVESQTQSGDP